MTTPSSPASPRALLQRLQDLALFVAPVLLVGGLVWAARAPAATAPAVTPVTGAPTATASPPPALAAALDGARIRLTDGATPEVPVAQEAHVVLLASTRCGHCHTMLERLAQSAPGDSLPYLRVVILEGVDEGRRLLRELGLRAEVVAPAPDGSTFLGQTRAMGTPMWWAVQPDGRVGAIQLGALTASELPRWLAWARTGVPRL